MGSDRSSKKRRREDSPSEYSSSKRRKYDRDRRRDDREERNYERSDRDDKYRSRDYDDKYYDKDDHHRRNRHHSRDRDDDRHRRRSRDRDYDDRYHRDRESSRSHRKHDSDKHYDDKESHKREKDKETQRSSRSSQNREKSTEPIKAPQISQKEIEEAEKKRKEEEEAKIKAEEEEKEQERQRQLKREAEQLKLDQEMTERKERIAKWREQVLKNKLQEHEEVEKALQAKEAEAAETGQKWSFDDDNADGYTTNEPDNIASEINEENKIEDENKEPEAPKEPEEPEVDPLDAYMQELSQTPIEPPKTKLEPTRNSKKKKQEKIVFSDDEFEGVDSDDEEWKQKIRKRELERVDHSTINYMDFRKDFYIEVPEIAKLTKEEVKEHRESLGNIRIRGKKCPPPIKGFHQCGLNDKILDNLRKLAYTKPTPIQAQAIPAIMSGRDVIGIAKTGSGKTLAFLLPMLRHIIDQPLPTNGEGPIGIIMAPTRELAVQIHTELRRFSKRLGIKSVCIFGGSGISHQIGDLKRGAAVAVCTPGRMIDILCTNAGRVTNLRRVTYLVLDEADRMFDMGFEPQIMRIIDNIRPDRQTVMFSATFPRQVEAVARKILKRPIIEIVVGGVSVVCSDVKQIVEVRSPDTRFARLLQILGEWNDKGSILIFVNQQDECDNVFRRLTQVGHKCSTLHGGKDQMDRASTISEFKSQEVPIMVATSVAARGLDVPSLNLVINYSVPNHYEDYVHRCGRTGRAGREGTAVTFISAEEEQFAPDLEKALKESGGDVPDALRKMSEDYRLKVTLGDAMKHGSGFGGSGYKFDEAEAQAKKKQEKLQRKAYLGDEADDGDEDSDEEMEEAPKVFIEPKVKISGPSSAGKPTNQIDALLRNLIKKPGAATLDSDEHTAEVEINEYPQQARWKVTHKDALAAITEFTGCAITTRGTYVPPGRSAPLGERKLFLYIEGPEAASVHNAVNEIKRILNEAANNAFPDREQYGKYSI